MTDQETDRAVVKTYVPAYEKATWVEHADELDMSQSEFVRTMVQAGRRDFAVDPYPEVDDAGSSTSTEDAHSHSSPATEDVGAETDAFEARVYALLTEETRSWDELLEAVTDDVEGRLEDALQSLQADNRVVYSGRNGGYEAVDG
jgi:hypothetical protein